MNFKVKVLGEVFEKLEIIKSSMGEFERCGVLFGKAHGNEVQITDIAEIENVKKSPVEFELDPLQTLKAFERAEESGIDVVGVWHTHPSWIAYPSKKDMEGMKIYPGIWIVISKSEVRAYFGDEKGFVEVELKITGSPR